MVPMSGVHNVRNALAAIAVAASRGVAFATIAEALAGFAGVKRRMELRGAARGVAVYDDFAHHPTAIAETLRGVRRAHPDARIWAIFEPRSASSCLRVFQAAFTDAFGDADEVVLASVFRTNLADERRLSVPDLVRDSVGPRSARAPHRQHRRDRRRPSHARRAPAISGGDVQRRLRRHPQPAARCAARGEAG